MRIRTIKPDFWQHELMAKLPEFTRLLAIALLNYADDDGYFLASPQSVRGAIFPFEDNSRKIQGALKELSLLQYIRLGKLTDGRDVGHIINFAKHQVINRSQSSKFKDHALFSDLSVNTPGTITAGMEGELDGKGNGRESSAGSQDEFSIAFLAFWKAYPRKVAKGDAWKAFKAIGTKVPLEAILLAIARQSDQDDQWINDDGKYIPYPATWLRDRCWENEYGGDAPIGTIELGYVEYPPLPDDCDPLKIQQKRLAEIEAREKFFGEPHTQEERDAYGS